MQIKTHETHEGLAQVPGNPDRQQQETAEHDAWFRQQVQLGLNAANAGDLMTAVEVEAGAAAWRAEKRRKPVVNRQPGTDRQR